MAKVSNNCTNYLSHIQDIATAIRSWPVWATKPLSAMREISADFPAAALTLFSYHRYVRRFTLLMCSILSKAPESDERFWRLALNLYDELGATQGFQFAHAKLLEGADRRPENISEAIWNKCKEEIDSIEYELVNDLTALEWPLNLFALGPGTESISDLFLDPIETWSAAAVDKLPHRHAYFDVHRPQVEYEHQMEISRILAEELSAMHTDSANSLLVTGTSTAMRVAERHYRATCLCWRVSQLSNRI
jgi:hypothetical protein